MKTYSSITLYFFVAIFGFSSALEPIFKILEGANTTGIGNCQGDRITACHKVEVDFDVDSNAEILIQLPGLEDVVLQKNSSRPSSIGSAIVYEYLNDEFDEAFLIWDNETKQLTGTIALNEDESETEQFDYQLESCGDDCTVLIHVNITDGAAEPESRADQIMFEDEEFRAEMERIVEQVRNERERGDHNETADRQSPSTYWVSLTMYISTDLNGVVSPGSYIRDQVESANQVFAQSRTGVQFYIKCMYWANINEFTNGMNMLYQVMNQNGGTMRSMLRGADLAYLLTLRRSTDACGMAGGLDVTTVRDGYLPIAFSARDCGHWVVAHELGHLFGAWHNLEQLGGFYAPKGFEYGNLIGYGPYASVMSYPRGQWYHWLGYFSTPWFTIGGYPLGDSTHDNRRQIELNRIAISRISSESQSCSG